MNVPVIEIAPFEIFHQTGVDLLYKTIEEEFPKQVFPDSPKTIKELLKLNNRTYWVALANGIVIGTAGIIILTANCCALKSMFLAKKFRGDKREIANWLLQTAIARAIEHGCISMYLGTMEQFRAAQKFYEKHGFTQITQAELPADFPGNTVDTVFYRKIL
jgi:N-acetylglutamate synthase-like GNAT family acetyltransferase